MLEDREQDGMKSEGGIIERQTLLRQNFPGEEIIETREVSFKFMY